MNTAFDHILLYIYYYMFIQECYKKHNYIHNYNSIAV